VKTGTREQLEELASRVAADKNKSARLKEMTARLVWYGDVWVLREATDGEFERGKEALIRDNKSVVTQTTFRPSSAKPLAGQPESVVHPVKARSAAPHPAVVVTSSNARRKHGETTLPPIKPPPGSFDKVRSLWRAVTGGRADTETVSLRRACCFELGGYSYAPAGGVVEEVSDGKVRIAGTTVILAHDETPDINVGEVVAEGRIIAKGTAKKPCPYLRSALDKQSGDTKYYCGGCGCGEWNLSELSEKLTFVQLTCPRTPPLFTPTYVKKADHKE
jgi:hypothetical protein